MKASVLIVALIAAFLISSVQVVSAEDVVKIPVDPRPVLTPGSDASFDKRLPPVLPGEEVSDGRETMKVWSSSGPVSVGEAPEPWRKTSRGVPYAGSGGVGVIVDQREKDSQ